ncbi:ComEA family DNA-binding protein [Aliamphritea hakodatensis]|uniref:ComEA family DNA-binding protein n=1 Tax=Aliamphritea hakodatensis TaxID=2895352 RepID=UPI0022FD570B|nr:ComEA family DNA-binding protein [Aliamphritea hakodatensis]
MYIWKYLQTVLISFFLIASAFTSAGNHQLDINTASAVQFAEHLNGVGAKKATAIVAYREQLGGFTDLEQLKDVKGIGEGIFAKNRDRIMLSLPAAPASGPEMKPEAESEPAS